MTEQDKRDIADKVCWAMKDKGLTFAEMIEKSGVSIKTLSNIRTAQWESLTVKTLTKIVNALDLKLIIRVE
jgi:transcriptional regulator with XRE-family HTH domain